MHRSKLIACSVALVCAHGCTSARHVTLTTMKEPPCAAAHSVSWVGPSAADGPADREPLSAWCESVGPAEIVQAPAASTVDVSDNGLIVASWNIHEGGGDVPRLIDYLREQRGHSRNSPAVVVLLQEVARADDRVPSSVPAGVRAPGRIRPDRAPSFDIAAVARSLHMSLAYVPSMRNGASIEPGEREDRGAAILSTLPLAEVVGIELPWVSQRRVAVMARVVARKNGTPWNLRVMSVHLDNRPRRANQAAALAAFVKALPDGDGPLVIGGDLNTWFGPAESAVRNIDAVVPRVAGCGTAATFRFGLRLDHLFTTLPSQALGRCEIVHDSFGSDHRPMTLHLFPGSHNEK
jgi:endonuclease/exonuclease/phosphatase family metal-dependent hydrolase